MRTGSQARCPEAAPWGVDWGGHVYPTFLRSAFVPKQKCCKTLGIPSGNQFYLMSTPLFQGWRRPCRCHEIVTPGGGVLDQILDGDVPSRAQKHTRSLYQIFQNVYPTLYQFFKNIYLTLYQFYENAYLTVYQLRKL